MGTIIPVGESERKLQSRVVCFFRQKLDYTYLGNLQGMVNSNIMPMMLKDFLIKKMGYSEYLADKAIEKQTEIAVARPNADKLYSANKEVYSVIKYGIKVNDENGIPKTVFPINWETPEENHFAIAEKVTVLHNCKKRPDLVVFVNGMPCRLSNSRKVPFQSVTEFVRILRINVKALFILSLPQYKSFRRAMTVKVCATV